MVRIGRIFLVVWIIGTSAILARQESGWTDFSDAMLGGSTIQVGARYGGPLPPNCPIPAVKDHYTIGFAQASTIDEWHQAMNDQMNAAVEALNAAGGPTFRLSIQDAAQNNETQISQIEDFLSQNVDLLIVSPTELAPLTEEVNKAWNDCIPVILLDGHISNSDYSLWIHADNEVIGRSAGEYVAQYCADHHPCNVLEIAGVPGSEASTFRHLGFVAGIERSQALEIANVEGDWTAEMAKTAAADQFKANPNIQVIFAHSDRMAEGAYQAAQEAGLNLSKILFVGVDGLPTADGGIVSILQGRLGATFIYPTGASEAIGWAKMILDGHINPPQELVVPTQGVFPENAQAMCDTYHCHDITPTAEVTPSGG